MFYLLLWSQPQEMEKTFTAEEYRYRHTIVVGQYIQVNARLWYQGTWYIGRMMVVDDNEPMTASI